MWSVIIISESNLSYKDKDLIANLIDSESHSATEKYGFILHNILEKQKSSEAIIEGKRCAAENIVRVVTGNTNHKVFYKKIKKSRI